MMLTSDKHSNTFSNYFIRIYRTFKKNTHSLANKCSSIIRCEKYKSFFINIKRAESFQNFSDTIIKLLHCITIPKNKNLWTKNKNIDNKKEVSVLILKIHTIRNSTFLTLLNKDRRVRHHYHGINHKNSTKECC